MTAPIVAAVDMGPDSLRVVERAAAIAKRLRAPLYVLHVTYALPAAYFNELDHRVRAAIDKAFETYTNAARAFDVPITCDTREGGPFQEIIRYARRVGAQLIAVAPHGRNMLKDLMLGSTPSRLLRKSEIPVLVVRGDRRGYATLVWLNDTGELAERAGALARAMLDDGARTLVGAALERPEALALLPEMGPLPPEVVELEAKTQAELENSVKRSAAATGFPDAQVVVDAVPAAELGLELAETHEADLIAVGTHGLKSVSNVLLGSTADAIVARAECDVLVTPPAARHFRLP